MNISAIAGLLKTAAPTILGSASGKGLMKSRTARHATGGLLAKITGAALLPVDPVSQYAAIGVFLVEYAVSLWDRVRTTEGV